MRAINGAVAFAALAAAAAAQEASEGRAIAERWCARCHVASEGGGADAAPAFAMLANDPNRSDDWLRGWIADPRHPAMPDPQLSRDQIEAVVAYLRSLRE